MTRAIDWILCIYRVSKNDGILNVKILRQCLKVTCALAIVAIAVTGAFADTPASQVYTQTVQPTQTYPEVPANGEGWFDVGGFCKVVDVGDLSAMTPPASGVPVFVPGPADQWENYRTSAPVNASYAGRLTLTTCCRPQASVGTLCADTANPVPVSRQYGKLNESDQLSATCTDNRGETFTDTLSFTCKGDPSSPTDPAGPDGQAVWDVSNESCTDTPWTSACNATCSGGTTASGTTTTYDSCGRPLSTSGCSISCCTPVYSYACNGSAYIATDTTCGTGSHNAGACTWTTTHGFSQCDLSYTDGYYSSSSTESCRIDYYQCNGAWYCVSGDCSGTCVGIPGEAVEDQILCIPVGNPSGGTITTGYTSPVHQANCSGAGWAPP